MIDISDALLEAAHEWYAARHAAIKEPTPKTFARLANAEAALDSVISKQKGMQNRVNGGE